MTERVFKRHMTLEQGGGSPDTEAMRAARHNIRYHLAYIGWLVRHARLARRRPAELGRSGRGGAFFVRRLPGRCAVDRKRNRQELVRAGEVAALVPSDSGRRRWPACRRRRPTPISTSDKSSTASSPRWSMKRARAASTSPASPSPMPCRRPKRGSSNSSPKARMATWSGWKPPPSGAASPLALWPEVRSVIMLGMNYGPDEDPLAILRAADRAAISVYAKGDDYHELIKPRLKELARWLVAKGRRRRESVRRYRRGDGKAARRHKPASAGRASTPISSRANSAPGCSSARSSPRSSCRPIRPSRTIAEAAAPVSTSARPRRFPSPTGSMRGAAFPI